MKTRLLLGRSGECWVNVYPERQRNPLQPGISHTTPESVRDGRAFCFRFNGTRALYVVRIRPRSAP